MFDLAKGVVEGKFYLLVIISVFLIKYTKYFFNKYFHVIKNTFIRTLVFRRPKAAE